MRAAAKRRLGRVGRPYAEREGKFVESVNCQRSNWLAFLGCQESA
jgi:hypothetical protein